MKPHHLRWHRMRLTFARCHARPSCRRHMEVATISFRRVFLMTDVVSLSFITTFGHCIQAQISRYLCISKYLVIIRTATAEAWRLKVWLKYSNFIVHWYQLLTSIKLHRSAFRKLARNLSCYHHLVFSRRNYGIAFHMTLFALIMYINRPT
jgi:hypothetical protein